jgi:hypothetical protein
MELLPAGFRVKLLDPSVLTSKLSQEKSCLVASSVWDFINTELCLIKQGFFVQLINLPVSQGQTSIFHSEGRAQ